VIDPEEFLKCVKRTFSLSDTLLARCLGVGRSSVWRFKRKPKNKKYVDEAKAYLESFNEDNLQPKSMTFEVYRNTLAIRKWEDAMERRMVGKTNQMGWMRCFYNLCKYLNRLPGKVTVEECAKVVVEQRNRYYNDLPQVKGIAYLPLREAVRGFFMTVRNMSAMHLTNLGVGKEAPKGSGKYSRQSVSKEVRHEFERLLVCKMNANNDLAYFEALGNSKFNFSTATRISASLFFSFSKHEYNLTKEKWMFEIWDKGTRGKKIRWEKILMGSLLDEFKKYCASRFDIPYDDLETELPRKTDHLFPAFINDKGEPDASKMRSIVKPALIEAGIPYKDFPPTHIWRHTFAQEALKATDYNYELVAELGGWVTTFRLKKHYGAMGQSAKERALLKMMGEDVPDVTFELEW
jgi:hypothetical protein